MADLRATAWHSMGFWVAKCPRPWCVNTEWHGPGPVTGRLGGLTTRTLTCLRCGLTCPADWPPNVDDIEAVLAQRPFAETRNWLPGETIHDLLAENAEHGLIDPTGLPRTILAAGDRLTGIGRQLVAPDPRLLAIGGK